MEMRMPVVGVSLKMYQTKVDESVEYAQKVTKYTGQEQAVEQFFCPSMGVIYPVSQVLKDSTISLGAQNVGLYANGAYTGEFSIESLIDMSGKYVEIGHCERRNLFNESDEMIHQKVKLTLENQLIPVLCIGEDQKCSEEHLKKVLYRQLFSALNFIPEKLLEKVIIAYEPVWAIGKSLAASAPRIHKSHQMIREILVELFSEQVAQKIRIIYGGSVSQENVSLIVSDDNVDGVFVGRFGHDPKRYQNIVAAVKKIKGDRKQ